MLEEDNVVSPHSGGKECHSNWSPIEECNVRVVPELEYNEWTTKH